MNQKERVEITEVSRDMNDLKAQMSRMWKHSNELTQAVTKTTMEVERLNELLQDDDRSTDKGLLTRINELEQSVGKLVGVSERLDAYARSAKKWFWWAMTILGGMIIAIMKAVYYS